MTETKSRDEYIKIYRIIKERFEGSKKPFDWHPVCSSRLVLEGIDIGRVPDDIDIVIKNSDINLVEKVLGLDSLDSRATGTPRIQKDCLTYRFNFKDDGLDWEPEIHLIAESEEGLRLQNKAQVFEKDFGGVILPVFPLEIEKRVYETLGKNTRWQEKAQLRINQINEYLNKS